MIGDNIRSVRVALNLTQQTFAGRINLKQGTIASVESNKRNISQRALLSICKEFNVRKDYLFTGKGEMFVERDDSLLEKLKKDYDLDNGDIVAIKSFLELPPEYRKAVICWGRNFAQTMAKQMGIEFSDKAKTESEKIHTMLDVELDKMEATGENVNNP